MRRYLRLYLHFLRFSFGRASAFRLDFFFRIFMDALWYAHYLAFFALLNSQVPLLGGWDGDQVLVFTGTLFVLDALQMTVLANNLWAFPMAVNKGDLDYHLVRPVSTLFFVSLRDFAVNSFVNLLMAIGVLAWALLRYPGPLPAGRLAAYLALLPASFLVHYCVQMLFLLPVFWLHSSGGLREIYWSLDSFTARPIGVFTGWVRRLLVSVVPLGVVVSFPVRVLFEGPRPSIVLHLLGAAAGSFLVLLLVWRRGLSAYSSASS